MAAPTLSTATVASNGLSIALAFTVSGTPPLLPASGVTGFTFRVNNIVTAPSAVTASGSTITATFASAIVSGQTVTVAYTPGNVTDSAGSPAALAAFTATAVTNSSTVLDTIAPQYASSALDTTGLVVTVTITSADLPLLPASGAIGNFSVNVNGFPVPIINISRSSANVYSLTLLNAVASNAIVLVSYRPGNVYDSGNLPLQPFSAQLVTNNSTVTATPQIAYYNTGDGTSPIADFNSSWTVLAAKISALQTVLAALDAKNTSYTEQQYTMKLRHMRNYTVNLIKSVDQFLGTVSAQFNLGEGVVVGTDPTSQNNYS